MISYRAALQIIAAAAQPLASRTIGLDAACGATAASALRSSSAVPPFPNAAMDGYALRSNDTRGASADSPVRLAVGGSVAAGDAPPATTPAGCAWEIMTGAAMPPGCDAVVALEHAESLVGPSERPEAILIREPLGAGQNRRLAGEDFAPGDALLGPGDHLTSLAVMALAAVGHDSVEARTAPRIAVITTGSELVSRGPPGGTGQAPRIRDANGPYLAAALAELRLPLSAQRTIPDDPQRLAGELASLGTGCDIVLTTGGVSAGRLDFVPAVVRQLGGEVLFHKVAIRPGKPLLFARLPGGPLLFGLPGNPVAVAVGLRFFVLAAVRALMGRAPETRLVARAQDAVRKRPALTFFAKAIAEVGADATLGVRVLAGQESFKISPLLRANCWAIVPEGRESVAAGELVEIAPLMPSDFPAAGA